MAEEVRHWKRPVHSGVVKKAAAKGIKKITSDSGFTKPAQEQAKKLGVEVIGHIAPRGSQIAPGDWQSPKNN